jgi:hypothetical protein
MNKTIKISEVFGPQFKSNDVEVFRELEDNEVLDRIKEIHPSWSALEGMEAFMAMRNEQVIISRQWITGAEVWTINPKIYEKEPISDPSSSPYGAVTVR